MSTSPVKVKLEDGAWLLKQTVVNGTWTHPDSTKDNPKARGSMPKPTGGIIHRDGSIENVYDDPEAHARGMAEHNKKVAKDPNYRSYNPQTDKA